MISALQIQTLAFSDKTPLIIFSFLHNITFHLVEAKQSLVFISLFFKPHNLDQLLAPKEFPLKTRYPSLLLLDDDMKSTADKFDGSLLRQVNLGKAVGAVNRVSWYCFLLFPPPTVPLFTICLVLAAECRCYLFLLQQERATWGCHSSPLRFRNCRSELNLRDVIGDVHFISSETWKYTENCNLFRKSQWTMGWDTQVRQSPYPLLIPYNRHVWAIAVFHNQLISEREIAALSFPS